MSAHLQEEHEEENSERWLLTYSDLITLLLALFIILYSIAQVDAEKFNAIAAVFREQAGSAQDAGNAPYMDPPADVSTVSAGEQALDQIFDEIKDYIDQSGLGDELSIVATDNYVRIHIKDVIMFQPDSAVLLDPSKPVLEELSRIINRVYVDIDSITFSGHTADTGDESLSSVQTSWSLSTERALTVLNSFVSYGLPPEKLSAQGFAHYSPVADNTTEEGMAQNRRVEITIYSDP